MNVQITLKLRNSLSDERTVILEPWAEEYELKPGCVLEVVAQGDSQYPLEVEFRNNSVVVYTFDSKDATVSVFQDGREATPK